MNENVYKDERMLADYLILNAIEIRWNKVEISLVVFFFLFQRGVVSRPHTNQADYKYSIGIHVYTTR